VASVSAASRRSARGRYLVAGAQQRLAEIVKRLLGAAGHQDLIVLKMQVVITAEFFAHRVLEAVVAVHRGVVGEPLVDGLVGGAFDAVRGREIRFAGAQAGHRVAAAVIGLDGRRFGVDLQRQRRLYAFDSVSVGHPCLLTEMPFKGYADQGSVKREGREKGVKGPEAGN